MAFLNFMVSPAGRLLRVVVGIVLIVVGLLGIGGTGGIVVAIIGLLPLAAGVFDFCLDEPMFGAT